MKVYQYEVWWPDGNYYLDYCCDESLHVLEYLWLWNALHFKVRLTHLTELPPF